MQKQSIEALSTSHPNQANIISNPTQKESSSLSHEETVLQRKRHPNERRKLLQTAANFAVAGVLFGSNKNSPLTSASALDMDAFIGQELAASSTSSTSSQNNKKLSDDEALCRFGQPSKLKGEACVRAGMSTKPQYAGSGVDAFGNVERGDFLRCKKSWTIVDGKYVSENVCQ